MDTKVLFYFYFYFLKIVQMPPLHGEIFEEKKRKKKLENGEGKSLIVVSQFANSGFSFFFFLMSWDFFPSSSPCPS